MEIGLKHFRCFSENIFFKKKYVNKFSKNYFQKEVKKKKKK